MHPLDDRQVRNLENIQSSSERLLDLINDILDLSRIEAGGIAIAAEDFDLERLLQNTVGMFATRADDIRDVVTFAFEATSD